MQHLHEVAQRRAENSIRNPENQIAALDDPKLEFHTKRVMNKGEFKVFVTARRALDKQGLGSWHVFPQVSLGEIIKIDSFLPRIADRAHRSINSKRCDLLIADNYGMPKIALEYQGAGHYQGDAAHRDLVKSKATRSAGMIYIEIEENEKEESIFTKISKELPRGR